FLSDAKSLYHMIHTALEDPECYGDLTELAKSMTGVRVCSKPEQKAVWLSLGFLLDYETFRNRFYDFSLSRPWVVGALNDVWSSWARARRAFGSIHLSVDQLEAILRLFGRHFKNVYTPPGFSDGPRNLWDAAQFIRS